MDQETKKPKPRRTVIINGTVETKRLFEIFKLQFVSNINVSNEQILLRLMEFVREECK